MSKDAFDPSDDNEIDSELERILADGPRQHHYAFAHQLLPQGLWTNTEFLINMLFDAPEPLRQQHLSVRWDVVGNYVEPDERLSGEGMSHSLHRLAKDFRACVITLPPAIKPVEAHMVAVVQRPAQRRWLVRSIPQVLRYFTINVPPPVPPRPPTTLGEWTPNAHLNYGPVPSRHWRTSLLCSSNYWRTSGPCSR